MVDEVMIERAAETLLRAAPQGSEVYLFGSHASGRAGPKSDLDFLVVEPSVADRAEEMFRLRRTLEAVFGDQVITADVIVIDRKKFLRFKDTPNSLAHEVVTTGRRCA